MKNELRLMLLLTWMGKVLCLSALCLLATATTAVALQSGDFTYTTDGSTITITKYTGSGGAVVIPSTIDSLPVARIGEWTFNYCTSLTSVTIPNSVTSIGEEAFSHCTSLTSITIGNGVTYIERYAFWSCTSLTSITIPNSVTFLGYGTFSRCTGLTNVTIGNGVTNIGEFTFARCTSLREITVDELNPVYSSVSGVVFNKSQTTLVLCPAGKTGAYTIPNSVIILGDNAFNYCTSLTSVMIPNSVTSLGSGTFNYCTSLTNVTIGGDIKYSAVYVFYSCTSLTGVYFKGNEPTGVWGDTVFENANINTIVYYVTGTKGWNNPEWCGRPTKAQLLARPGSTRDYPYTAFDSEEGLPKKIGLPEYRINTASLNVALEATLFYMRTLSSPVNIRLAYNSAPTPDGADTIGLFGKNWRFRYESVIGQFGPEAKVITSGGRTYLYTTPNGEDLSTATATSPITLVPPAGVFDELKFYGPGQYFELREKTSKVTFRYAVSGGTGNAVWRMTRITDRNGNQINLAVDGATGRITSITDPANREVTLTYSTGENLCTGIMTPDGRSVTFAYDAHKNLTGITDMAGYVGSYTYDDMGFLTQMTTAGRQNTFTYIDRPGFETVTDDPENTGDKVVASVTNAKGQVTRYELLPNNAGVKRIDAKGGATVFTSSKEQTGKVADPLGNISQTEYSNAKMPVSFTDSNGKITTFDYDARGNLLTTNDALANQTTMTYDTRDNLLSRTNALGKTWNYAYDLNDRVTSIQTPLGNTTQFTYFDNGRLNILRDARNNATTSQYDEYGDLTRVTDPLINTVQLAYDSFGLHCGYLIDPRGKSKHMQYDYNDRLTILSYESVLGIPLRVNAFNAFGQTSLTDELGQVTLVTRNEFGYLTSITDPLGNRSSLDYDPNNNPVSATDPLGRIMTTTYDAANRPLVITDALGKTVTREYDADGNMLSLTDKNNNKTAFKYDANNRLIETKDPLLKAVTLGRDALGRAAMVTNARSQVIRYTFDDDGRIIKKEFQETAGGDFVQKAAFTYDPNGNILSRTDDWGTTTFTYNPLNQPTEITYPTGKTVSFAYSAAGHLAAITYPNGLTVNYTYDDYNRLVIPLQFYNAAGTELQGSSERPNNVTHLVMALSGTTKTIDFTFDKAGNMLSNTRPNNTRTTYVYDNAQRVTNVLHQADANTLLQCNLAYNKVGGVTQETVTGSAQKAPDFSAADTATYNACNQVTKRDGNAYIYDADGNLTEILDGTFAAMYTPENRPSTISRKPDFGAVTETIQYTYDASGLRVKRAVDGGVTTQFHYGPDDRLLFTTDGAGNVTSSYVWNGTVLAAVLTGDSLDTDLRYLHLDRLGNVMTLTDSTGAPIVKYAYQPYGFTYRETVPAGGTDDNLFTFVGGFGVQDEGAGFFYMKNRFYDANTGRFLQRDPIGFEGGVNLYAYAGNNPMNWIDPSGLEGELAIGGFSGLTGQVEIARNTKEDPENWKWVPAKYETEIHEGDAIRASEDSSAIISFNDMSHFVLKPDTTIITNITAPRTPLRDLGSKMWNNMKRTIKTGSMERDNWDTDSDIHWFDMGLDAGAPEQPAPRNEG